MSNEQQQNQQQPQQSVAQRAKKAEDKLNVAIAKLESVFGKDVISTRKRKIKAPVAISIMETISKKRDEAIKAKLTEQLENLFNRRSEILKEIEEAENKLNKLKADHFEKYMKEIDAVLSQIEVAEKEKSYLTQAVEEVTGPVKTEQETSEEESKEE